MLKKLMKVLSKLVLGLVSLSWMFGTSAHAVVITQLSSFGAFFSTTTFSQDFEMTPFDTPQLGFDLTTVQITSAGASGGVTSSGSFVGGHWVSAF